MNKEYTILLSDLRKLVNKWRKIGERCNASQYNWCADDLEMTIDITEELNDRA